MNVDVWVGVTQYVLNAVEVEVGGSLYCFYIGAASQRRNTFALSCSSPASLLPSSCWSSSASPRAARRLQVNRPTRTSPSSIIKCPNCRPSVFRSPDQGWDGLGTVTHQRRPATTSRSADNCSAEKSLWGPPPPLHSSPRFCNLIHRHLTLHLKHRVWGVFFCRYDVCNFSVDFWGEGAER